MLNAYNEYCKNRGCNLGRYILCRLKRQCKLDRAFFKSELNKLVEILKMSTRFIEDDCLPNLKDWRKMDYDEQYSLIYSYNETRK